MQVSEAFVSHSMPDEALDVRCHALHSEQIEALKDYLVKALPDCYITRRKLRASVRKTKLTPSNILSNKLPDSGSVMSGDFGEILTLFFLSSECTVKTVPVKKWRYKQDRRKAAPHSDVVILYRRSKNNKASKKDFVICAEAKQKATDSSFDPISGAIEGYEKDRNGRLARTLVWLKEKAIDQDSVEAIDFITRFTEISKIEYAKYFKAVAIIDLKLLDDELIREIPVPEQNELFEVIVLGIPDLKIFYETIFQKAIDEVGT
jgi:hypothetical protein